MEVELLTTRNREEGAVACKCLSLNALDFIKHRFLAWGIVWAHQPLAPHSHVVKYAQRVGTSDA